MHSSVLIALLTLTATVYGFQVPKNQPDGVYEYSVDANGTAVHTKIGDVEGSPASRGIRPHDIHEKHSFKRWGAKLPDGVSCSTGPTVGMDTTLVNHAAMTLGRTCDRISNASPRNRPIYAVYGSAVAYVCNYARKSISCSTGEIGLVGVPGSGAFHNIGAKCGAGVPGWYYHKDWQQSFGFQPTGDRICEEKGCGEVCDTAPGENPHA